jgi:hypothetical protein
MEMHLRAHRCLLATSLLAGSLLAPRLAYGMGVVEGFYGITRPPSTSFHSAVEGAEDDPHLFKDSLQIAGGDVLLDFDGPLEIGAIADTTWASNSASQTAVGGLLGFRLKLGIVRVDLLGEAGGHRYGDFLRNPDVDRAEHSERWFAYVGVRPGFGIHIGDPDRPGFLIGVLTFARWDLATNRMPVTVSGTGSATANGTVRLGGPSIGATLRAGFEF